MKNTKFVTFYSYKGGVGRTLAMGNIAWAAALDGKKVIIIDFDLEAPGVPSLVPFRKIIQAHKEDKNKRGGLFELILAYRQKKDSLAIKELYTTNPITCENEKQFNKGEIYIIPAGNEDKNYKENLQSFNWKKFYEEEGGRELFYTFRDEIAYEFENPDLVLIDSRTGLTDIGSICTALLPDKIVVLTGLNDQNLNGSKGIIDNINNHSEIRKKNNYLSPIDLIIVASHVPHDTEFNETRKKMKQARQKLGRDIDIAFHYVPILSLEEKLLVQEYDDKNKEIEGIVNDYYSLYSIITGNKKICSKQLYNEDQGIDKLSKDQENQLEISYLYHMLRESGHLSLAGIDKKTASDTEIKLNIGAVYTALLTKTTEIDLKKRDIPTKHEKQLSALELLNKNKKLVLLGEPGSGKTTFVNYVAWCLAGEYCCNKQANLKMLTAPIPDDEGKHDEKKQQVWDHDYLLPVHIVLRDFAAKQLKKSDDLNKSPNYKILWNYIALDLEQIGLKEYLPVLKKEFQDKGCLILLDGLDEVPEAGKQRDHIKKIIESFCDTYPNCRILVTSRIYAYQKQQWRLSGFQEAILANFSKGQIQQFIDRWYAHIAELRNMNTDNAQERAELLKHAILINKKLFVLAERPLLLTLMASIHAWRGGSLPEKREELYADAVDLLLDWWEKPKFVRDHNGKVIVSQPSISEWLNVDRSKVRFLLNKIAFDAHKNQGELTGTADIPEEKLVKGLMDLSNNPDLRPARLIEYLSDRAGLIVQRANGIFSFPHRTFQEYLAACYLTGEDFPEKIVALFQTEPNRWREVTLLAGARAIRGSIAMIWSLVNELCDSSPNDKNISLKQLWSAHIAAQALVETIDVKNVTQKKQKIVDIIIQWLKQIIKAQEFPPTERAMAGNNLAIIRDSRPEVMDINHMIFCLAPGGDFWMGDGKDMHKNSCKSFWMAKYPVTNAQYNAFVEAGGYHKEHYWTEAIRNGQWENGTISDYLKKRKAPTHYGSSFVLSNHPVVGITWYEAIAFTRWLTEKWQNEKYIPENWHITLPTETQWEKSARGGLSILSSPIYATINNLIKFHKCIAKNKKDVILNPMPKRNYPWGDSYNENFVNCKKSQISSTSTVGCFSGGISPYGCEELSGNVLEWTLSIAKEYPYKSDDGRENINKVEELTRMILRGGSFWNDENNLRCITRNSLYPDYADRNIGFRILFSPFFSSDP